MQEENTNSADSVERAESAPVRAPRKRAARRPAGPPEESLATAVDPVDVPGPERPRKAAAKKSAKRAAKKAAAAEVVPSTQGAGDAPTTGAPDTEPGPAATIAEPAPEAPDAAEPAPETTPPAPVKRARRTRKKAAAEPNTEQTAGEAAEAESVKLEPPASVVLFQPPTFDVTPLFSPPAAELEEVSAAVEPIGDDLDEDDDLDDETGGRRRRRRRGGRGRRKRADDQEPAGEGDDTAPEDQGETSDVETEESADGDDTTDTADVDADGEGEESGSRRRRRRRRRRGEGEDEARSDESPSAGGKTREARDAEDEVSSVKGSTRLEAKKQRRREGREAGRRRPPILTESEFLARREAVDRVMAVRQRGDLTQIAVLEDNILVEHYVSRASQNSMIGNVYLGRVQNVLPAMEAAFVDIGRGRNAVVYAGEIDWAGLGHTDGPKRIEDVLKSGQSILVQVTKDPVGHKGARLTGQISLPGRYVVYVPGGSMSGISRKLPENERNRLKKILKKVVPDDAGVIVRTAAEGASEEELTNDVGRLQAEWEAIQKKTSGSAPALLHGEPDLAIKVVRDLFNEDFTKLVVSGNEAWSAIHEYVTSVASSLRDRVEKWARNEDIFAALRIDEQIAKALDRKVWLPSGGSLVIDRTEAMTVIDVNTGKFTGAGGNLEETVTKNNLEAAEEIVRQLRLRDIGGIVVIDFIDMVLESNRDLVLRRLVECLGRDRTKHQVAEVTSLGLVQMTRKRIGTGLLEAFSEPCPHCKGRGVQIHTHPAEQSAAPAEEQPARSERRGRRRRGGEQQPEKTDTTDKAEASLAPKLEAMASPGEASPADLIPVGLRADETNGAPMPQETTPSQPDEGAEPETKPRARRGRRRAERPAGSPDEHAATPA